MDDEYAPIDLVPATPFTWFPDDSEGADCSIAGEEMGRLVRTAAESAVRAVSKCAPFNLPADKYETWAEVVVNFDPSDMF